MTTRMTTRLPTIMADALAARAEANHRSVNGELIAILEKALSGTPEQQKPAEVLSSGCYFAADGTLMNANGTRSIFDDVDK